MNQSVIRDEARDVLTLTLNRPERLNALNEPLLTALVDGLASVGDDVRAVVLRGAGRAFSSGHDLKEANAAVNGGEYSEGDARANAERMQSITRALRDCPVPVIAVVHGYAIGGGAEIALSSDLVIAARGAVFQFTETAVGLVVTNGASRTLPRTSGPFVAKELILLGEPFSADTAKGCGLVNRVVDEAQLESELGSVVDVIRLRAPIALRFAKSLIDAGADSSLEQALAAEVEAAVQAEMTEDAREGSRAFTEKREPNFVGR